MECDRNRKISHEIRNLSHRIGRYIDNIPSKKKIDSITGTNGWIIGYLSSRSEEDVFQKDIEKEFDITRSTASKVIDLMERKGLVERMRVSHDGRLKKIVLTEKSKSLSECMQKDCIMLEKTLTAGFSQEEIAQMYEYIERMKNNLEIAVNQKEECK